MNFCLFDMVPNHTHLCYFQVKMNVNNMDLEFPHQCFINNEFVDSSDGATFDTINPTDESVSAAILTVAY